MGTQQHERNKRYVQSYKNRSSEIMSRSDGNNKMDFYGNMWC